MVSRNITLVPSLGLRIGPACEACLSAVTSDKKEKKIKERKKEGRSINKLQNGIILLIFRLRKFRIIHFVGNLILSRAISFIAMTSL